MYIPWTAASPKAWSNGLKSCSLKCRQSISLNKSDLSPLISCSATLFQNVVHLPGIFFSVNRRGTENEAKDFHLQHPGTELHTWVRLSPCRTLPTALLLVVESSFRLCPWSITALVTTEPRRQPALPSFCSEGPRDPPPGADVPALHPLVLLKRCSQRRLKQLLVDGLSFEKQEEALQGKSVRSRKNGSDSSCSQINKNVTRRIPLQNNF